MFLRLTYWTWFVGLHFPIDESMNGVRVPISNLSVMLKITTVIKTTIIKH